MTLPWKLLPGDISWQHLGACYNTPEPDLFFPDPKSSARTAKDICWGTTAGDEQLTPPCPVRERCLTYALTHDERAGVWGGTTEDERRELKKRRTIARNARRTAG